MPTWRGDTDREATTTCVHPAEAGVFRDHDGLSQRHEGADACCRTRDHPGILAGYLPNGAWPNSLALLPPPPVAGSAALAADAETYRVTRALHDTPRWALATHDANLSFPEAALRPRGTRYTSMRGRYSAHRLIHRISL
jgi:hypothetical protein